MRTAKNWKQAISPYLKAYKAATDKIFAAYNREAKKKGLKTTAEFNILWNKKYKTKLDKIEKLHDDRYRKLWYKYHA